MEESREGAGPFVTAALFCERLLHNKDDKKDDVITLVRLVDQFTSDMPDDVPNRAALVETTLFIGLKSGGYLGPASLRIERIAPDGSRDTHPGAEVTFSQPEQGAQITLDVRLTARESGTHWFEVFVNDRRLTRTPILHLVNEGVSERAEGPTADPQRGRVTPGWSVMIDWSRCSSGRNSVYGHRKTQRLCIFLEHGSQGLLRAPADLPLEETILNLPGKLDFGFAAEHFNAGFGLDQPMLELSWRSGAPEKPCQVP